MTGWFHKGIASESICLTKYRVVYASREPIDVSVVGKIAKYGTNGFPLRHIGLLQIVIMRLRQPDIRTPNFAKDSDLQSVKNDVIGLGRTDSDVQKQKVGRFQFIHEIKLRIINVLLLNGGNVGLYRYGSARL